MSLNPKETKLIMVGNSRGFRLSKRVTELIGEMGDTFRIEVDSKKGEIILQNTKKMGDNKNE